MSPPITGPSATPPVVSPPLPTAIPPTAAVAALGVQTSTLPTATRKRPYRAHLVASGGSGSYIWRRSKGSLPKGLTLSRSGSVTGKAKSRGATRVRVMVTDSTGATSLRWVRIRVR